MSDASGLVVVSAPWTPGAARLVSRAREMANSLGCWLRVVTDPAHAPDAGAAGADEVRTAEEACAGSLREWVRESPPRAFLFEDCPASARVAGRLAGMLDAPVMEGVVGVDFDPNDLTLLMRVETYGCRQIEEWAAATDARPAVALVRTDRLPEPMPGYGREAAVSPLP